MTTWQIDEMVGDYTDPKHWQYLNEQLPEQPRELNPYAKLFMAILFDAIRTLERGPVLYRGGPPRGNVYKRTMAWLMSDDERYCTCSFVTICEYFGWAHEWVRRKILESIEETTTGKRQRARKQQVRAHNLPLIKRTKKKSRLEEAA